MSLRRPGIEPGSPAISGFCLAVFFVCECGGAARGVAGVDAGLENNGWETGSERVLVIHFAARTRNDRRGQLFRSPALAAVALPQRAAVKESIYATVLNATIVMIHNQKKKSKDKRTDLD
jgi:hypothetical protein